MRSRAWFDTPEYYGFSRRAWLRSEGFSSAVFDGRPIIGLCNSWSELTNCNASLRPIADAVKRGVWMAGGFPLEFPVMSLAEMLMKPTAMLFRNLMSMEVEESIRANPLDAVMLLSGCDKTTPAMLMGAASADVPAMLLTSGPMLAGDWHGRKLGAGTDGRKLFDLYRAGEIDQAAMDEVECALGRSQGHCTVMGTASTMAILAEALGMSPSGSAAIPAPDSRRLAMAEEAGRRIVDLAREDLRPSRILTRAAFENALRVQMAIGGSTNAVVHLLAIAGRAGVPLTLDDFDRISRETPWLVNLKPSGEYLMEDFYSAGGVPAVLRELLPQLHTDALTVSGKTVGESIQAARCHNHDVIRERTKPLSTEGGTAILYGNLAPDGAVIKPTAASPELLQHRGRALVFESRAELMEKVDSDLLPVDAQTVLVMKSGGPKGGPGMPEWGQIPLPKKLLRQGVRDMVRLSDARMSGTSFGTVVLHISPESAVGGPLALVETGDEIQLDVAGRRIDLLVPDAELQSRRAKWQPPAAAYVRGYGKLFLDHVEQANLGCDFDFLKPR
ncbi:MAG: dihydroxy-acid dehydratase [Bryobacteraceae bacterium]|nr:dihydroxy-acid dehydratase [Bryobacteraceae bacterium]